VILTRRETRFFQKAKCSSAKSSHYRARIGAIIVSGNYIVSEGYSQEKSHPRQHRYNQMTNYYGISAKLHAEIDALISSGRMDLTGAEIYVYREDKMGRIANCRPCVSCTQALKDAGVKHIYYTCNEGFAYEQF
jgi:deoxycytidylate deaminase